MTEQKTEQELSDEEVLTQIVKAMKDNAPTLDDKQSVHTFLFNVAVDENTTKIANLRDDKDLDELGRPKYPVRALKEMQLISDKIMDNDYFSDYFKQEAENILATSLSREGFLVRQATTQTKQVADVTRRKKINKGLFGKKTVETSGGDMSSQSTE